MEITKKGLVAGGISLLIFVFCQVLRFILSYSFDIAYTIFLCGLALLAVMLLMNKNNVLLKIGLFICMTSRIYNLAISIGNGLIYTVLPFSLTIVFACLFISAFLKKSYFEKVLRIYGISFLFIYLLFETLLFDLIIGFRFTYYGFLNMIFLLIAALSFTLGMLCVFIYHGPMDEQASARKIKRYSNYSTLGVIGLCCLGIGFLFAIILSLINYSYFAYQNVLLMDALWIFVMLLIDIGCMGVSLYMASIPYKEQIKQFRKQKPANTAA